MEIAQRDCCQSDEFGGRYGSPKTEFRKNGRQNAEHRHKNDYSSHKSEQHGFESFLDTLIVADKRNVYGKEESACRIYRQTVGRELTGLTVGRDEQRHDSSGSESYRGRRPLLRSYSL